MANRVLIITSDAADAESLKDVLGQAEDGAFDTEWVTCLSAGLERLRAGYIDAILVDLFLSDSQGMATFDQLFAVVPQTPILTLHAADNQLLARETVQRGAQGHLSKDYFSNSLLPYSLRNIIQRKAVEESLFIERTRAEITLNSIGDAVISTDMAGNVDYLNTAAESMTGWLKEEACGYPIREVMRIINDKTYNPVINPIEVVLQQDKPMTSL